MSALVKEIYETTHGIVCITMMDKGYADNIATNMHKYKAVYPNNVLAGSSGHINDTILYEEAYRVLPETYGEFVEGSLAKNTHTCICQCIVLTQIIKTTQYSIQSLP